MLFELDNKEQVISAIVRMRKTSYTIDAKIKTQRILQFWLVVQT